MKYLLFLLFIGYSSAYAQTIPSDTIIYDFPEIEQNPEFPGGIPKMQTFIAKNVRYPALALKKKIEGTVLVRFIIEKDGSISHPEIVKDPGGGLGEEALRVILMMPNWKPAQINGQTVRSKMNAPVRFRINR